MSPRKSPTTHIPEPESNEATRQAYVSFQLEAINKQLMDGAERATRHESRIETQLGDMKRKLEEIPEKYVSKQELKDRLDPLKTDVAEINGNIGKVVWLVITAVIVALLGLVIMNPGKFGGL